MPSKEDYLDLSEKVSSLKERRAILASNEEKKANERKELLEELVKFGVDPEKPLEEIERLEKEISDEYERAKKAVDQFEVALDAATGQSVSTDVVEDTTFEVTADLNAEGQLAAAVDAEKLSEPVIKGPEGDLPHSDDLDLE